MAPTDPLAACCRSTANGVEINVKVVPGASRSRIAGLLGDCLKIQVAAPPEKGKANDAVITVLSKALHCPRSAVSLIAGAASPRKTFLIREMTLEAVLQALPSN